MSYQLDIDWLHFLAHYWQKKPVVLRKAFKNFQDPITPDELAGLAMEQEIESRLVTNKQGKWDAKFGPFESYDHLGETNWSLLVQAVDHWHAEAATLVEPFRCLPQWIFDDLMISYATPKGGVGPHIDQYDVFIIQGMGKRRWRVGDIDPNYKQFCSHPALLHVEQFTPIIDEEITAGDILYIPPGFPHDGVCIDESLSYSVGFRSPTAQDLLSGFADYVLEHDAGKYHYANPDLQLAPEAITIQPHEISRLKEMMIELIQNEELFNNWFGCQITHSMHELNIVPVEPEYTTDEVADILSSESLHKVTSIRIVKIAENYFIHGEPLRLPASLCDLLAQHSIVEPEQFAGYLHKPEVMNELVQLINKGYWYFSDEGEE